MPRAVKSANERIELRVPAEQKRALARAAAIERLDLTGFILRASLPVADAVIERAERLELTERDSARVLDLIENPPAPSVRLLRAAKAGRRLG